MHTFLGVGMHRIVLFGCKRLPEREFHGPQFTSE